MADQVSVQEFAAKVRAKYPGAYDSVPDEELTQRVVAKYPEYRQSVSVSPGDGAALQATPEQPGFFQRAGEALGVPTSGEQLNAVMNEADPRQHPSNLLTPFAPVARMAGSAIKEGLSKGHQEFLEAAQNIKEGGPVAPNVGKAVYGGVQGAIGGVLAPVGGQSAINFGEDIANKNYKGAAGTAAGLTAGAVLAKGAEKLPDIIDAIPSKSRAMAQFQDVMAKAKNVPVDLTNAQEGALKLVDWQKKTQLGPTVNKFLNRITNPKLGQLTYGEARDFYQLLGSLSADEKTKLAPSVRADLTKMVVGLREDIGNAAGQVGMKGEYGQAMTEFRRAMKMRDVGLSAGKAIVKALPYGAAAIAANNIIEGK